MESEDRVFIKVSTYGHIDKNISIWIRFALTFRNNLILGIKYQLLLYV